MSFKGCQVAEGLSTFNLVTTFLEINLGVDLRAIKVLENFLRCWVRVMSAAENFIRPGHIYTEVHVSIWLIDDDSRGHPWCWASDRIYDILAFQVF